MPPVTSKLAPGAIDKDDIVVGDCTHPAGHCFGSDGGTGIPQHLKVPLGRGGTARVQTLSPDKSAIIEDMVYLKCQYCEKYQESEAYEDPQARPSVR